VTGPVTVVGGAGRTGRLVVSALRKQDADVRVLTRDERRARGVLPDGVAVFTGDVRDPGTLAVPLRDVAGVVVIVEPGTANTGPDRPEATMYQGVRNVLEACAAGGTPGPRFVLVSQIYVTRSDHPMNQYGRLLDWRLRGEDAVRGSGLPYTIVRPSWLTDEPGGRTAVRLEQGDTGDGSVSRGDVAEACVQALGCPSAAHCTFEMYNEPGPPPAGWGRLFSALRKDP
jgi:uncharacterized protein YbjT (DUF2867 family)